MIAPDTSPEAVEHIAKCLDAVAVGGDDFKSWLGQSSAALLRALSGELAMAREEVSDLHGFIDGVREPLLKAAAMYGAKP